MKIKILKIILLILLILVLIPFFWPLSSGDLSPSPYEESLYKTVMGHDIHYRLYEPNLIKGQILMVHGLGGSTFSFDQNYQALVDEGYRVLLVDLPGFGYSSRDPFDHSQSNRSKLLWTLLDTISLDPWLLLGHSMGGGTVTAMAHDRPESSEGVVLVAGALEGSRDISLLKFKPFERYAAFLLEKFLLTERNLSKFLTSAYGFEPSKEALQAYINPLQMPGTASSLIEMVKSSQSIPLEKLKSLEVPFFGIWGQEDTWVPTEKAESYKAYIRNFEYRVIKDSHHCPMETHAESFNDLLIQWLERNPDDY